MNTKNNDEVRTKWGRIVPRCTRGKNHRYNTSETGVCSKCGFDVFDMQYVKVSEVSNEHEK